MESLKEKLLVKGAKCNLQFSTKEREYYEREAGFTDEEIEIFRMRSRGFSIVRIAQEMAELHDKYYSTSTIEGRIRSIKNKILRIL
ncbi:MAG: hypothetical protein ACI4T5_10445 [Prevotella sp.]